MHSPDRPLELSIVVPAFNESGNIAELLRRVAAVLTEIRWELIVVDDDSPDGTATLVRDLARSDPRVRCLQRIGRRGLSSACIEGMLASAAPVLAVMDADLQHDETRLPLMLSTLRAEQADMAIATRYGGGGSTGDWGGSRLQMSRWGTRLSRLICKQEISDPMSGFFMLTRQVAEETVRGLSGMGFKVLVDILATARRPLKIVEVPYTFRERFSGESKLDSLVVWDFGMLLLDKTFGRYVPARLIAFGIIGGSGVLVHMSVLLGLLELGGVKFEYAQAAATLVAMTSNYLLNNLLTFRDMRRRGWSLVTGWISFALACSVGAVANVGIAGYLYGNKTSWFLSAIAGIAVGLVWNYVVSAAYTWRRRGQK